MQVGLARVSDKGQIVIPGPIRKSLRISTGSRLVVMTDGVSVHMRPVEQPGTDGIAGLLDESRRAAEDAGLASESVGEIIRETRRARGH